jgi:hypothetical protein
MLYEVKATKQREDEDFRRWFTDDFFDLFVWFSKKGKITAFQLSYDKNINERAITWRRKGGFMHTKVDDGEHLPSSMMTPVLVSDGVFDNKTIAERFKEAAAELDSKLVNFVYKKILDFPPDRNL